MTAGVLSAVFQIFSFIGCATAESTSQDDATVHALDTNTRLFVGPRFYDPTQKIDADGVLVDNQGIISGLWNRSQPVPQVRVIQLKGALAVPGLHDAHLHLEGIGQREETVQLHGLTSLEAINQRISDFVATRKGISVVHGRGWDQTLFLDGEFPTAQQLSAASEYPLILSRTDGHAIWLNQVALRLTEIDRNSPEIPGGEIFRNNDGSPTGVFIDTAADNARERLAAKLGRPSDADRLRWLKAGAAACSNAGLTAVHDMGMSSTSFTILQNWEKQSRIGKAEPIPLRIFVYLDGTEESVGESLARPDNEGLVRLRGIKLYADGALGSRGAALLKSYRDRRDTRGR